MQEENVRKNETPESRKLGKGSKLILGFCLVFIGFVLVFGSKNSIDKEVGSFVNEPVQVKGFSTEQSKEGLVPAKIIIPNLSIDLPVKKAEIVNGYWEVFDDSAAWGDGSGFPGEIGNQVIFAHSREGLFFPLKDVKEEMKVYVFTDDNWFEYEVFEIIEVYPSNVKVIEPSDEEILTLYTCSGYSDSKRLVVKAKRI